MRVLLPQPSQLLPQVPRLELHVQASASSHPELWGLLQISNHLFSGYGPIGRLARCSNNVMNICPFK
ncbi:hypothetical protein A2U01_0076410 [Trifolium medium]|uniref:Uncharacterized protein n=1 Tax=Trifolium medium TaxID=97028 RepID=A0A392T4T4_9FABA|nr:hypothetical protein [Trifolium medium]